MPDDMPNPSSVDEGGSTPSDQQSGGNSRGTLRDIAHTALQSVVDRSIALAGQGRFDEMEPKIIELLTNPSIKDALGYQSPAPSDPDAAPIPPDVARYAQRGRQAEAAEALAKIKDSARGEFLQEQRLSDARELFAEFGDQEIDLKDWQGVDPTNFQAFPLTDAGHAAWKKAANQFRRAMYTRLVSTGDEGSDSSVDKDRQAAQGRGRTPQPRSAGKGASTPLEQAKAVLDGKMDPKEYVESIRSRSGVS